MIDYARSVTEAIQTVVLEEGPLPEFSHFSYFDYIPDILTTIE